MIYTRRAHGHIGGRHRPKINHRLPVHKSINGHKSFSISVSRLEQIAVTDYMYTYTCTYNILWCTPLHWLLHGIIGCNNTYYGRDCLGVKLYTTSTVKILRESAAAENHNLIFRTRAGCNWCDEILIGRPTTSRVYKIKAILRDHKTDDRVYENVIVKYCDFNNNISSGHTLQLKVGATRWNIQAEWSIICKYI